VEFATNTRAIGGFVRWMTRDADSQQTDRPARVPLSGAQAAALLRIGGEPMRETERADGGTNDAIVGAAAQGAPARQAPASRAAGRITLAVLGLMGFSALVQTNSEQVPPNAPQSSGLVGRAPDTGASHTHDTLQGHHKMLNKITGVTAAAVVGIAATVAGAQSAAVQWKVEDGGNGHWYKLIVSGPISWNQASLECESLHGHLATINDPEEDNVVANVALQSHGWNFQHYYGPWLGGYQETSAKDYIEPRGGWKWVTGEPWQWAAWEQSGYSEPNNCNCNCGDENFLQYKTFSNVPDRIWNDVNGSGLTNCPQPVSFIIEWDADCNNDSIVDYGQILTGQLADSNTNGVPDICEQPQCRDADITNNQIIDGADLGAMLAFWGPVNPVLPQADINRDGEVNGADLSLLLSFWGPCP
jgi:hypothetical protein